MRKTGDGCRGGPEFVAGKTDESVRPAQYFDHPAGAFCAGDWRTSPLTPPTQPQAPPVAPPQVSTPAQYAGASPWMPPLARSAGNYYEPTQHPVVVHQPSPLVESSSDRAPKRTQSWSRSNDRCHFCHQKGHWKVECPERMQRQRAQGAFSQTSGTRTKSN